MALAGVFLVAVVAVVGYAALRSRASTADRLAAFYPGASCAKVGVIEFTGARSTLYRCAWTTRDRYSYATGHSRCAVWVDGSAYDVTKQERASAVLGGERRLC